MIDPQEARLKALFASAPEAAPDARFTAEVAGRVRTLRRRRRFAIGVVWVGAIVLLAALLAPYAPLSGGVEVGLPQVSVPADLLTVASRNGLDLVAALRGLPVWWYYVLGTGLVPLVLLAWLVVARLVVARRRAG